MTPERNISLYMLLRLVMLFSVLISLVLYQRTGVLADEIILKTYQITFFTFLVTSCFVFLYEKAKDISYFLASQFFYDILFTTVLIYFTGPYDSIYTAFYFFNILFAAIIFRSGGALIAGLLSAAMYAGVTALNTDAVVGDKSFSLLTTLTAFVAIALLSGQLVEELRRSRQRISRLEQLSEEIVESLDSGLIGVDSKDVVRKVNRTAQTLLGLDGIGSLIGQSFAAAFPSLAEMHGSRMHDLAVRGTMRKFLVTRVDLPESHSMILFRDLSEVLSLEEKVRRQERLAGVGRLAAGVAHEIRNPIASISGAAQLLSGQNADAEEAMRLTQLIVRESDRVDRLVAQLLKFAKPSVVTREAVDVGEVVANCVESMKTRPDFQKSAIDVDVRVDRPLVVQGNQDEISEVISNLLVNSIQALSGHECAQRKRVTVEGRKLDGQIEIIVTDNGPGIPRDFRGRVFDPFFTTKASGTGLGLAQVHKIIREHDGQIDLETEEGKGTSLKIRLPG